MDKGRERGIGKESRKERRAQKRRGRRQKKARSGDYRETFDKKNGTVSTWKKQ